MFCPKCGSKCVLLKKMKEDEELYKCERCKQEYMKIDYTYIEW